MLLKHSALIDSVLIDSVLINSVLSPQHSVLINSVLSPQHSVLINSVLSPQHSVLINSVLSPQHSVLIDSVLFYTSHILFSKSLSGIQKETSPASGHLSTITLSFMISIKKSTLSPIFISRIENFNENSKRSQNS